MHRITSALVAGGAGFLGSWVVDILRKRGIPTVVVDDLSRGNRNDLDGTDMIVADVGLARLKAIMDERAVDTVFHLATPSYVPPSFTDPIDDLRGNTLTTLAVLEAARAASRRAVVAVASSAAVYGEGRQLPMSEDHPIHPVSPYGISKYAAELYARLYSERYQLPTFCIRPFSLYGPRQRKQVVFDLMTRVLDGESPLTVLGAPEVTRDLVYVKDAAQALVALAQRASADGEAYNIASGIPTTLGELAAMILEALQRSVPVRFTGRVRPGDPLHWFGDPGRARALQVECRTSLRDGIEATAAWVLEQRPALAMESSVG